MSERIPDKRVLMLVALSEESMTAGGRMHLPAVEIHSLAMEVDRRRDGLAALRVWIDGMPNHAMANGLREMPWFRLLFDATSPTSGGEP